MNSAVVKRPLFSRSQWVKFIGGIGKIKNFWLDAGAWIYAVEMRSDKSKGEDEEEKLTILLHESDIQMIIKFE